jgi:hypothetical protein
MRPAATDQIGQAAAEVPVETAHVAGCQGAARPGRRQPRSPQDLISNQIADPRQPGLVHQAGFQRHCAPRQCPPKLRQGHREGVGAETVLVRVKLDRSQPAGVAHGQPAAVCKAQGEAIVAGVLFGRDVEQPVDACSPIDDQPAAHPEMEAQDDVWLPTSGTGIQQHQLAPPPSGHELPALEGRHRGVSHQTPLQVPGVGCLDSRDRAPQGAPLRQGPVTFHLGQLRHQGAASSTARPNTASSMGSVSLPVKVFC